MSSSKVAVVTGSNKGIGLAIVKGLCKVFEGEVLLTSRDEGRGREAVKKLEEEGLKPKYHQLDVTSLESIETIKEYLVREYGGLDVLVNNAGIAFKHATTVPFLEQATVTMGTNFTGTLNISKALLPILKPHSRVVNISSHLGCLERVKSNIQDKFTNPSLTEDQLVSLMKEYLHEIAAGEYKEKGWTNTAYGTMAMGIVAMTKIHARGMADKEDILVNCCCPGHVRTDMSGDKGPLSPDEGAETPIMVAMLPPGSQNGEFWRERKLYKW